MERTLDAQRAQRQKVWRRVDLGGPKLETMELMRIGKERQAEGAGRGRGGGSTAAAAPRLAGHSSADSGQSGWSLPRTMQYCVEDT